jgi:hypothetical protein
MFPAIEPTHPPLNAEFGSFNVKETCEMPQVVAISSLAVSASGFGVATKPV